MRWPQTLLLPSTPRRLPPWSRGRAGNRCINIPFVRIASSLPRLCELALLSPCTDGATEALAQGRPASRDRGGSGLESGRSQKPRACRSVEPLPSALTFDPPGLPASGSAVIGKGGTGTGSGGPEAHWGENVRGAPTALGTPVVLGPRGKASAGPHPSALCNVGEVGWLRPVSSAAPVLTCGPHVITSGPLHSQSVPV